MPNEPSPPAASAAVPPGEATGSPDGATLLALERRARQEGSGLTQARLQGRWLLERIWPRGSGRSADLAGGLLRALGASLTVSAATAGAPEEPNRVDAGRAGMPGGGEEAGGGALQLTNSVRLAGLELRFSGPGRLQGRRPLLLFRFERLQLLAGASVLLERRLPSPEPRRQPFFALIAMEGGGSWLAARGRSGGLALWRRSGAESDAGPGGDAGAGGDADRG